MKANLLRNCGLLGLFIVTLLFSPVANAQESVVLAKASSTVSPSATLLTGKLVDDETYITSTNITLKKGQQIQLGLASVGGRSYATIKQWAAGPIHNESMGGQMAGKLVTIKKFKQIHNTVYALINFGPMNDYSIDIHSALFTKEIIVQ